MAWLYGRIVDCTGWTYPTIDALTMSDAEELVGHWGKNPPLIDCARAFVGVKAGGPRAPDDAPAAVDRDLAPEVTPEQFEQLKAEMNHLVAKHSGAGR